MALRWRRTLDRAWGGGGEREGKKQVGREGGDRGKKKKIRGRKQTRERERQRKLKKREKSEKKNVG